MIFEGWRLLVVDRVHRNGHREIFHPLGFPGMMNSDIKTYRYRRRGPLGGLAANLTATTRPDTDHDRIALQIGERVRLTFCRGMYWKDISWMSYGLSLHARELAHIYPAGALFEVIEFTYPLADFRPEVAAFTVDGWLQENLGLYPAEASVNFNRKTSAYEFHWPEDEPFSG